MDSLLTKVGTTLTTVIGWFGTVVTSLTGESGELAPLLAFLCVGFAITVLFAGVKMVRSFIWGA